MLDWTFWLSTLHTDTLVLTLAGILFVDAPRYAITRSCVCLFDMMTDAIPARFRRTSSLQASTRWTFDRIPSVCVLLSAHNAEQGIAPTIGSILGTYPNLELIIVCDGSTDDTYVAARRCTRGARNVQVYRRPRRGGKSSSLNFALNFTRAEVVIVVDADCELEDQAIWRIVEPFSNPQVGAVSATIGTRNAFQNLLTAVPSARILAGHLSRTPGPRVL